MRPTKTPWRSLLTVVSVAAISTMFAVSPMGASSASAAQSTKPTASKKAKQSAKKKSAKTAKTGKVSRFASRNNEAYFARKLSQRVSHYGGLFQTQHFNSRGRSVRIDVVRAEHTDSRTNPAVIILHGASGLGDGTLYYPQARALADRGINAFVVHYFDGVGEIRSRSLASPMLQPERNEVIQDAISFVQRQSYVDPQRIGAFGLSLGGFHVMDLAARDERITAVVNVVGAMPMTEVRRGVNALPPTLILHGEKDRVVPVRRAYELARLMDGIGAEYKMKIFKGQGHAFKGEALTESIRTTADFFQQHLAFDPALGGKLGSTLRDQPNRFRMSAPDKMRVFEANLAPTFSAPPAFPFAGTDGYALATALPQAATAGPGAAADGQSSTPIDAAIAALPADIVSTPKAAAVAAAQPSTDVARIDAAPTVAPEVAKSVETAALAPAEPVKPQPAVVESTAVAAVAPPTAEATPAETAKAETAPIQTTPTQTAPTQTAAAPSVPTETVPTETAPAQTVKAEAVKAETAKMASPAKVALPARAVRAETAVYAAASPTTVETAAHLKAFRAPSALDTVVSPPLGRAMAAELARQAAGLR